MHNHNLEIHIEEDIRMPNGSNPYINEQDFLGYLQGFWASPSMSEDYAWDFTLPGYQYQGMSPEIMQALGNVFSADSFNIASQLQSGFSGTASNPFLGEDVNVLFGDEGTSIDWDVQALTDSVQESGTGYFDPENSFESLLNLTNVFDPESLAATLSQLGGIDPDTGDPIRAGEVKALTPEMIEKTTSAYYNPYEEAQRESLVEKLGKARGGVSTGGFAGSGARQSGLSGAERLYRGGYEDILSDIMKMRAGATEDVLDTIYGWQELMSTP